MLSVVTVIALIWLLILTVLIAAVVRHLGALQAASNTGAPGSGFNFDTDGPYIPSPLPDQAVQELAAAGVNSTDFSAIFFSAGCGQCLHHASAIVDEGLASPNTVALVTGNRVSAVDDLRRLLDPAGVTVVVDPHAQNVVKSLNIQSTPYGFRVVDGQVVAKAFIRDVDSFRPLAYVNAGGSDASPAVPSRLGPTEASRKE